jgi:drug/metabolite transporter (DMT)-like permease
LTEIHILFVFLQQKREDLAEMTQISGIQKAFIQLHLSVMLAGFTGLFGKLITLNEVDIVWYRMLFTSIILLVFTGLPQIERKKLLQLGGCGALLGLHWMLFYGSIKASNVSIGVICYSLVGFFTAIIEPIIYRKKISTIEILFSLITVLGLLCIFSFDARYRYGISIGVLSSFVAALYGVCNKKVSVGVKTRTVLFYQMSAGLVVVSMIIPFYLMMFPAHQDVLVIPEGSNLWWMLCHALFCTVAMYILQIQALRTLSAFTVNLTYNLEPCYTIAIAFIVFHEARELNFSFYIGIALILISVILQTWRATLSKK